MAGYQFVGVLEIVDIAQRHLRTNFAGKIINSLLDIAQSKASRNNCLCGHLIYWPCACFRSAAK